MIHHLYSHDYGQWRKGVTRSNGAITYSQDIVNKRLALLLNDLELHGLINANQSLIISTCPLLSKFYLPEIKNNYSRYGCMIHFLHTYPYKNPTEVISQIVNTYNSNIDRWIFPVAYQKYAKEITDWGVKNAAGRVVGYFLPMRLGSAPKVSQSRKFDQYISDGVNLVWFGNIYQRKKDMYSKIMNYCVINKINFLTIASDKLYVTNGVYSHTCAINQVEAWRLCQLAGNVLAVGRCALEAYALECNVMICGDGWGGYVENAADWVAQESINWNSRVLTPLQEVSAKNDPLKSTELLLDGKLNLYRPKAEQIIL
jgi:hypothetical protein